MPDMDAMGIEDVCGAMDTPTPENERMTSWKIHQYLKASHVSFQGCKNGEYAQKNVHIIDMSCKQNHEALVGMNLLKW